MKILQQTLKYCKTMLCPYLYWYHKQSTDISKLAFQFYNSGILVILIHTKYQLFFNSSYPYNVKLRDKSKKYISSYLSVGSCTSAIPAVHCVQLSSEFLSFTWCTNVKVNTTHISDSLRIKKLENINKNREESELW